MRRLRHIGERLLSQTPTFRTWGRRLAAGDRLPGLLIGLALVVGVVGLWVSPFWSVRTSKLALLELALLAVAASLIRIRPLRWLLWMSIVGFAFSYNARACVTTWRLLMAAIAIETVAARVATARLESWLMGWRILTMAHTGMMLIQMQGIAHPFFNDVPGGFPIVGMMDNTSFSGAYTAITLPLFADGWGRRAWLVPSLWAIAATQSLGAMVVACVMLALMARWSWRWPRWRIVLAAGLMLAAYAWQVEPIGRKLLGERTNRLIVWQEAVTISNHSTRSRWFGWGPGQFMPAFRGIGTRIPALAPGLRWDQAHNEWIQALFEFGRFGVLLVGWMVGRWVLAGWRAAKESAAMQAVLAMALGWLLVSVYHFPAHYASLAIVGILLAGLLEAARRGRVLDGGAAHAG